MKQKIHREFTLVALTTILLTTVVVTAVFYSFFKKEVMEELAAQVFLKEQMRRMQNRSVQGWDWNR